MSLPVPTAFSLDDLRAAVRGHVSAPGDGGYDEARSVMYDQGLRPAAVVRVADAPDVATVVRIAAETGLELAVRSGGHSGAGFGATDGGLVVDVRNLDDLELDVPGRTAWAGSGLTAGAVTTALAEHGLAIGFGDTGSVGLGGLVTGGGIGYLVRKHGLSIDQLVAAELVTADGQVRVVDETHEPDLFWAVRGGGGNLGVVTRFRFRLQELPSFVGGMLILPATADTVAGFIAAAEAAPEALSTIANVMPCPPMPFVAEEHVGRLVILGMMAFAGPAEEADAVYAPFRALAEPLADLVQAQGYPAMFPPDDPDYHPTAVSTTLFLDHVDRDVAATILEHLEASDAAMRVAQLRVLGGAMARVPVDATAFAHRSSRIMAALAAFYDGEDDRAAKQGWLDRFEAAVRQGDSGAYVNFVNDEGPERVRAAYPGPTWDRLAAIKARHDPTNLFRRNQNVPPAGA